MTAERVGENDSQKEAGTGFAQVALRRGWKVLGRHIPHLLCLLHFSKHPGLPLWTEWCPPQIPMLKP